MEGLTDGESVMDKLKDCTKLMTEWQSVKPLLQLQVLASVQGVTIESSL